MRRLFHLRADQTRRMPWKNGRGVTEELAVWPERARFERGDFDWRISKAAVIEPGTFSTFTEFERIFVVIGGESVVLAHDERAPRVRLRRLEPYSFSGAWPTRAELPNGPIDDFNVLTRRGVVHADVEALTLNERRLRETIDAEHLFVHVVGGAVKARVSGEESPFELSAGENLWVQNARPADEFELVGTSNATVVLAVRIARVER